MQIHLINRLKSRINNVLASWKLSLNVKSAKRKTVTGTIKLHKVPSHDRITKSLLRKLDCQTSEYHNEILNEFVETLYNKSGMGPEKDKIRSWKHR